jgi:hypothetical protein
MMILGFRGEGLRTLSVKKQNTRSIRRQRLTDSAAQISKQVTQAERGSRYLDDVLYSPHPAAFGFVRLRIGGKTPNGDELREVQWPSSPWYLFRAWNYKKHAR